MDNDEAKRTLAKLHLTFLTNGFMSISQVLKIIVTTTDAAEVYAKNGQIYHYRGSERHTDRLEQVGVKSM